MLFGVKRTGVGWGQEGRKGKQAVWLQWSTHRDSIGEGGSSWPVLLSFSPGERTLSCWNYFLAKGHHHFHSTEDNITATLYIFDFLVCVFLLMADVPLVSHGSPSSTSEFPWNAPWSPHNSQDTEPDKALSMFASWGRRKRMENLQNSCTG